MPDGILGDTHMRTSTIVIGFGLTLLATYAPDANAQALPRVASGPPWVDNDRDGQDERGGDCDDTNAYVYNGVITVIDRSGATTTYTNAAAASAALTNTTLASVYVCGTFFGDTLELSGAQRVDVNFYVGAGISGVSGPGLSLVSTQFVDIYGGVFRNNYVGISAVGDSQTWLSEPWLRGNTTGIELDGSTGATVMNADVRGSTEGVLLNSVATADIEDPTFVGNTTSVVSDGSTYVTLTNPAIRGGTIGVYVTGGSYFAISEGSILGPTTGVFTDGSAVVDVNGTEVANTTTALHFTDGTAAIVDGATVSGNTTGAYVVDSGLDVYGGARVVNNGTGIELHSTGGTARNWTNVDNTVMNNTVGVEIQGGSSYNVGPSVNGLQCYSSWSGTGATGACNR